MFWVLPGSTMLQLKLCTVFVQARFQYTPTPIALTEPLLPRVLLARSDDTTGPRKESKSVYVSNPMVAIIKILSCRFMFIVLYCVVRLNKYSRFIALQKYNASLQPCVLFFCE